MLFNLDFVDNTVLSCFFFFFLIIDLHFLIPAAITEMFNPIAELIMPIGIPTIKAKTGMETYPVIVENTISKWSI